MYKFMKKVQRWHVQPLRRTGRSCLHRIGERAAVCDFSRKPEWAWNEWLNEASGKSRTFHLGSEYKEINNDSIMPAEKRRSKDTTVEVPKLRPSSMSLLYRHRPERCLATLVPIGTFVYASWRTNSDAHATSVTDSSWRTTQEVPAQYLCHSD